MNNILDLVGKRFGRLLVIKRLEKHPKWRCYQFECKCDCGNLRITTGTQLKREQVKSCGCWAKTARITHHLTKHPLYHIWSNIKSRCYNINNPKHIFYKDVAMCEEWLNNPEKFIEWALLNGWKKGLQIDKDIIPKSMGITKRKYSPEMCCFVSAAKNREATSHTKLNAEQVKEIKNSILPPRELSKIYNMPPKYISSIKMGNKWKHIV